MVQREARLSKLRASTFKLRRNKSTIAGMASGLGIQFLRSLRGP
jgi:hypothetical protein